jgi:hypothetical protein
LFLAIEELGAIVETADAKVNCAEELGAVKVNPMVMVELIKLVDLDVLMIDCFVLCFF